jgi:hypothetical protein
MLSRRLLVLLLRKLLAKKATKVMSPLLPLPDFIRRLKMKLLALKLLKKHSVNALMVSILLMKMNLLLLLNPMLRLLIFL